MSRRVNRAASPGEVAVFFLIAATSPPVRPMAVKFTIDGSRPVTREETVKLLNAAPKPILCTARPIGGSLEIITDPITDPDALRARQRYLQLASGNLVGLAGLPASKSSAVLVKSEHEALVVSADLLRSFYEEYDIPHSSSQAEAEIGESGMFTPVVHVYPAGHAVLYLDAVSMPGPEASYSSSDLGSTLRCGVTCGLSRCCLPHFFGQLLTAMLWLRPSLSEVASIGV